jgi:PAS domain S-box-containing protein
MAHPLLCWDIIAEGMGRRRAFAPDIKGLEKLMLKYKWHQLPLSIENCIIWENKTVVVTDASLNILLASSNMYNMNGYKPDEVIGNSPKMFQGAGTTAASKQIIRTAVKNRLPFACDVINYRKDGSIYNCHIDGYPIFNVQGELVNFVALENLVC